MNFQKREDEIKENDHERKNTSHCFFVSRVWKEDENGSTESDNHS